MNQLPTVKELFKAGAHYGHRRNRSDARANKYVFTFRNRVSVIDLDKTRELLAKALDFLAQESKRGATILFVGTKMQAKDKVKEVAEALNQPYIIERWPGGLLTNYEVMYKAVKEMLKTEKGLSEEKFKHLKKKERLMIEKNLKKRLVIFGGLRELRQKPDVLFVIDAKEEAIAISEARSSKVPIVAICDTSSNPNIIDYPIIANDDSRTTIELILDLIKQAIKTNFKPVAVQKEEIEERMKTKPETGKETKERPKNKPKKKAAEAKKTKGS